MHDGRPACLSVAEWPDVSPQRALLLRLIRPPHPATGSTTGRVFLTLPESCRHHASCRQPAGSARGGWWRALTGGTSHSSAGACPWDGCVCRVSARPALRTLHAPASFLPLDCAQLIPTLLLGWLRGPLLRPSQPPSPKPLCPLPSPITLPCFVLCKNTSHYLE